MTLVREAMLTDPKALPATASVQEAGELLTRPEVRAVLVVDGERLVGVVTCEGLVERVVAAGRDPRSTTVGDVAEPVAVTVLPDVPVEDAVLARLDLVEAVAAEHLAEDDGAGDDHRRPLGLEAGRAPPLLERQPG